VRVHNALAKLHRDGRLGREELGGEFLYLSRLMGQTQLQRREQRVIQSTAEPASQRQEAFGSVTVQQKLQVLLSALNEKQKRLYLGFESLKLGHGGDVRIARISGVDVKTIARGRAELQAENIDMDRIRQPGAGRPSVKKTEVTERLNELMRDATAGDPMSRKKWSRKDTRQISGALRQKGIDICANTVAMLLRSEGYSLRVNRKSIAETQHPDRNEQFEIIAQMRKAFEDEGQPILSVDTKKKELVGNFKNAGTTWRKDTKYWCMIFVLMPWRSLRLLGCSTPC
jgi:transposase